MLYRKYNFTKKPKTKWNKMKIKMEKPVPKKKNKQLKTNSVKMQRIHLAGLWLFEF
jgi:hypothetical protein